MAEVEELIPYALQRLINDQQDWIRSGNTSDNKVTSNYELDKEKANCLVLYDVGETFIDTLDPNDVALCYKLFNYKYNTTSTALVKTAILGQRMIISNYISLIPEVYRLKEIFKQLPSDAEVQAYIDNLNYGKLCPQFAIKMVVDSIRLFYKWLVER